MCVRERGTVASHAISRVPAAASIESENGKREALIECSLELARPLSLPLNLFLNKQKKRGGEKTPGKLSLEQIAKKAAEQGYAGIECSVRLAAELDESDEIPPTSTSSSSSPSTSKTAPAPVAGAGRGLFASTLKRHGLSWTPVVLSSGPVWRGFDPFVDLIDRKTPRAPSSGAAGAATPEQHAAALAGQLDAALALCPAADLDALFLSSHADEAAPRGEAVALVGSDAMGTPDAMRTVRACSREAEERGFSLCFETHRGRVFGSPWDALDLLREMAAASAGPRRAPPALALPRRLALDGRLRGPPGGAARARPRRREGRGAARDEAAPARRRLPGSPGGGPLVARGRGGEGGVRAVVEGRGGGSGREGGAGAERHAGVWSLSVPARPAAERRRERRSHDAFGGGAGRLGGGDYAADLRGGGRGRHGVLRERERGSFLLPLSLTSIPFPRLHVFWVRV